METLDPETMKYIMCLGIGFGSGLYFSIFILDKQYKKVMHNAINEIHRQYNNALKIMRKQYGLEREKSKKDESDDTQ